MTARVHVSGLRPLTAATALPRFEEAEAALSAAHGALASAHGPAHASVREAAVELERVRRAAGR
jgi:hypothetical protein